MEGTLWLLSRPKQITDLNQGRTYEYRLSTLPTDPLRTDIICNGLFMDHGPYSQDFLAPQKKIIDKYFSFSWCWRRARKFLLSRRPWSRVTDNICIDNGYFSAIVQTMSQLCKWTVFTLYDYEVSGVEAVGGHSKHCRHDDFTAGFSSRASGKPLKKRTRLNERILVNSRWRIRSSQWMRISISNWKETLLFPRRLEEMILDQDQISVNTWKISALVLTFRSYHKRPRHRIGYFLN